MGSRIGKRAISYLVGISMFLIVGGCGSDQSNDSRALFKQPGGLIWSIAFAPDGETLASAGTTALSTIRKADGVWLQGDAFNRPNTSDIIFSLAYSMDGRYLASGHRSGRVSIWDSAKPQSPPTIIEGACNSGNNVGSAAIEAVVFSPNNNDLAVGCFNGSLVLIDVEQPTAMPMIVKSSSGGRTTSMAFSSDGVTLAALTSGNNISLWNTNDIQQAPTILTVPSLSTTDLAFRPNEHILAVSTTDGAIWSWNTDQPNAVPTVVVTGAGGNDVGPSISSICFTSDGKLIAAGYLHKELRFWDATQSDKLVDKFTNFRSDVQNVGCNPTELLVAATSDDIIHLFEIEPKD
jgi:WD40 repeat protein